MASAMEAVVSELQADAALSSTPYLFGGLEGPADFPLIVWVPGRAKHTPTNVTVDRTANERRRAYGTTDQAFDVLIWAETFEQGQAMLDGLAIACKRHLSGSATYAGHSWHTDRALTADYAARGRWAVAEITLRLPVIDLSSLVEVVDHDHQGDIIPAGTNTPITVC